MWVEMSRTAYEDAAEEAAALKRLHENKEQWWDTPHTATTCAVCLIVNGQPRQYPRWHWAADMRRQRRYGLPI